MYLIKSKSEYTLGIEFASVHEEIIPKSICVYKCLFLKKEAHIYGAEHGRSTFYPNLR